MVRRSDKGNGFPNGGLKKRVVAVLAVVTLLSGQAPAQSAMPISNTDLSKESENPVSRITTTPLRYEAEFNDGAYDATKDTFELDQALLSFRLTDDWTLITRTKLPAEVLPPKELGEHWASGLSNGYTTFFLSPEFGCGFYWGVGPVLYYPATSTMLGTDKWGSGPSLTFIKKDEGPWVYGAVPMATSWPAYSRVPVSVAFTISGLGTDAYCDAASSLCLA